MTYEDSRAIIEIDDYFVSLYRRKDLFSCFVDIYDDGFNKRNIILFYRYMGTGGLLA